VEKISGRSRAGKNLSQEKKREEKNDIQFELTCPCTELSKKLRSVPRKRTRGMQVRKIEGDKRKSFVDQIYKGAWPPSQKKSSSGSKICGKREGVRPIGRCQRKKDGTG